MQWDFVLGREILVKIDNNFEKIPIAKGFLAAREVVDAVSSKRLDGF